MLRRGPLPRGSSTHLDTPLLCGEEDSQDHPSDLAQTPGTLRWDSLLSPELLLR